MAHGPMLLFALCLLVTAAAYGHAHAHAHAHEHAHEHAHPHEHEHEHEHEREDLGYEYESTRHLRASHNDEHHHNHDDPTHRCIHDEIVDRMKDVHAAFREKQEIAWAEEAEKEKLKEFDRRLLEETPQSSRRKLSGYHSLRIKFDYSRLGYDETNGNDLTLDDGADRHGPAGQTGDDFACYEGGPTHVKRTFNTGELFSCSAHKLTSVKRSFLKYTLLPRAEEIIGNALRVSDDPSKGGQSPSAPLRAWSASASCLGSHGGTCYVGQCDCDPIPAAEREIPDADFVLYVTARPTDEGVIAWATTLIRNSLGRPIAGMANFNPRYLQQPKCSDMTNCIDDSDCPTPSTTGYCDGNFKRVLGVAVHEIVHALGFSSSSWDRFVEYPRNKLIETDATTGVNKIISPNVVAKVRDQFGCSQNTGAEIENYGGSGTAGSHWEKRIIANEFMNPQAVENPVIFSAITLALFEDTGWYKPDYSQASHLPWGFKQGCSFITEKCNIGWNSNYFCTGGFGCSSFDFRGKGYCDIVTYNSNLDSQYQYFSGNEKLGGSQVYMDYCPMYRQYSNTPCNQGIHRNPRLQAFNGEHKDMLNENGYCFSGTYQNNAQESETPIQSCHDVQCAADLKSYTVRFYDYNKNNGNGGFFTVTCPTNGGVVSMPANEGFSGSIQCYPANIICVTPTDCPKWNFNENRAWQRSDPDPGITCSGHGSCNSDLSCTCDFGYNGTSCETRLCPKGIGGLECSGRYHGTCLQATGKCNCESTHINGDPNGDVSGNYSGSACDRLKCPRTAKAVCNGRGQCGQDGECDCDGGFSGPSCELAPGCAVVGNSLHGCSGHGSCHPSSGACSCNQMNSTMQHGTRCPGSGVNGADPLNADATSCRYWEGAACDQVSDQTLANNTFQLSEAGAIRAGQFFNTSHHIFTTPTQTYSFFSFEVDDINKDVAFIVDILDGSDVDIFASFDDPRPTARDMPGTGFKWKSLRVNDENNTKEILQLCGSYSYEKRCTCDGSNCKLCNTDDDCKIIGSGSFCTRQGRKGVSNSSDDLCFEQDINSRVGTMHVGVLSNYKPGGGVSTYKTSVVYSKCSGQDNVDDGGSCYHGSCDRATGICHCHKYGQAPFNMVSPFDDLPAWSGSDCSAPSCLVPAEGIGIGIPCAGNGDCIIENGLPKCQCRPGWSKNSTMCNEPAEGQSLPISVPSASIFSSEGFKLASKGLESAGDSSPEGLGLGKYQMFYFRVPESYSAISINVSASTSDHAREFKPIRGRPDFLVAATQGTGLEPTFGNLNLDNFDYESWAARELNSHVTMIRSNRDDELWYVTVLSTTYARADLQYEIHIQGSEPSGISGGCSKLAWGYRTCGGGRGECRVLSDTNDVCDCSADNATGAGFRYAGEMCGTAIWPIPRHMSNIMTDDEKKLPPNSNLSSGIDFGEADPKPLEPGQWTYYELDTRNTYGSLSFTLKLRNLKEDIQAGIVSPVMLVKSSEGGAQLPTLNPDQDTLYDISGAQVGEQRIVIEGGEGGANIANGYYVAVYNQLHSRAALNFNLEVVSVDVDSAVSCSILSSHELLYSNFLSGLVFMLVNTNISDLCLYLRLLLIRSCQLVKTHHA